VSVASAAESPQIAVEPRIDVPQFVDYRAKFFAKRQIQEPGKIKVQNIEHLAAAAVEEPLHGPFSTPADDEIPAAFEPQRSQRGVHAELVRSARLRKTDGHAGHVDVAQQREPGGHVLAHPADMESKIETCGVPIHMSYCLFRRRGAAGRRLGLGCGLFDG